MVLSLNEAYEAITPKELKQIPPKKRKTLRKPVRKIEPFTSDSEADKQIAKELGKEGFGKTKRLGTSGAAQRNIELQIQNEIKENYENDEEPEMFDLDDNVEGFDDTPPTMEEMEKEAFEGQEDFRRRRRRRRRSRRSRRKSRRSRRRRPKRRSRRRSRSRSRSLS